MKKENAFSMFEMLFVLVILSLLTLSVLKPQINSMLSIRAASFHLQKLQKDINDIAYKSFLIKKAVDKNMILNLINNAQVNNKFFSLELRASSFYLTINKQRLRLNIKENANGSFSITCNPSNELCRKIYHRKFAK